MLLPPTLLLPYIPLLSDDDPRISKSSKPVAAGIRPDQTRRQSKAALNVSYVGRVEGGSTALPLRRRVETAPRVPKRFLQVVQRLSVA